MYKFSKLELFEIEQYLNDHKNTHDLVNLSYSIDNKAFILLKEKTITK